MTDDDSDLFDWVTEADERILEYLFRTDSLLTASAIELNLDEPISYGEIVKRLNKLESNEFVEKNQWRYYQITTTGEVFLTGHAGPAERSQVTDSQNTPPADQDGGTTDHTPIQVYEDAADRLERVLDIQHNIINDVDTKAAHVTRLLGILIGVAISVLSLTHQVEGIDLADATRPTLVSFSLGFVALLLSMVAASITYLSSRFKMGMSHNVGKWLSNEDTQTTTKTHLRRAVGTYGYNIERNVPVIKANFKRFRTTILLLLVGVTYLATAGVLFAFQIEAGIGRYVAIGVTISAGLLAWYVLSGKYLTLDDQTWLQ